MCGIAGFIGKGNEADLERMIASIRYRGPDDSGVMLRGRVGLAHARLSILDLSSLGHQPMMNTVGTVAITYNGEIYNFKKLRRELEKKGHTFTSDSDTEVILALYDEYGEECFRYMNGMFALVLYDYAREKLILARDRAGQKPLYWGMFDGTLIFGSELKALTQHPLCKKDIDYSALQKYMVYEYVPAPQSILQGVQKLQPATCLVYQNNKIRTHRYWEARREDWHGTFADAIQELDTRMARSVRSQMISDVPLGILLSGGLDSSAIAFYARQAESAPIKTFSVGFEDTSFDESQYARRVASTLGTAHNEYLLRPSEALAIIPRVMKHIDEPLADPSLLPTFLLSEFTRRHVTVALGGDGGDELFAGYDTFRAEKYVKWYEYIPRNMRAGLIEPLIRSLPVSLNNMSIDFKLKKFMDGFTGSRNERHQRWLAALQPEELSRLLVSGGNTNDIFMPTFSVLQERAEEQWEQQLLYQYFRTYLADDILTKVDRASMAHSLEVRAPFLDASVMDFVFSLPYSYKLHGGTTKYIVKKLMKDKLPHDIIHRSKKGFGVPIARWLRGPLRTYLTDMLHEDRLRRGGIFQPAYVQQKIQEHLDGKVDNRKLLWTLLAFEEWRSTMYTI